MTKNNVNSSLCGQVTVAKDEWAGGEAVCQNDFGHVSKPDGSMTKTNRPFAFFRRAVKLAAGVGTACVLILGSCAILTSCGEDLSPKDSYKRGREYYKKGDHAEAVKWFRKAAEKGNMDGINHLARCYAYGDGVQKDIEKAAAWWKKMGEEYFMLKGQDAFYMGQCYFYGRGVAENKEEAMKWYAMAIVDEDSDVKDKFDNVNDAVEAGYMYGVCYSLGYRMGIQDLFGFKKTEDCQGYVIMGLKFAANRGHRKAQELLDDLRQKGKL